MTSSESGPSPYLVLVGHCTPDSGMLRSVIAQVAPKAMVVRVTTGSQLAEHRCPQAIWLVNRVLDGDFDSDDGMELIANTSASPGAPTLLLISNLPEAQTEAIRRGALLGFGKKALYADATKAALARALEHATSGGPPSSANAT
ncbi:MAG: hypothetical protein JNL80_00390 [Phycisphaerae bacterium]|jgi:hypothetical protein|nr:hypothetical protein [Phycisphaerae bacterium]